MANSDAPRGLVPRRMLDGSAWNGAVQRFRKEASVILAVGDAVVLTGTSSIAGTNNADTDGIALVTRAAAASGTITGVVVGIRIDSDRERFTHTTYMAAADTGDVYVATHPNLLFEIQEDSVGNNLAATDVGEGVDLAVANADTSTGKSQMEIDSSTSPTGGGTADQLQVIELVQREDNALGTNAKWLVRVNEHTFYAAGTMI